MSTHMKHEQGEHRATSIENENNQNSVKQQQEILNTLVQFYSRIRNPTSAQIANIQKQFVECQKKVLKVVEYRKDLQSQQQIQQAKIEYMQRLQKMQQKYIKYQQLINSLVEQCHSKQSQILKLQTMIMRVQSSPGYMSSRFENYQGKSLNRIQQNIKQIKMSVGNLALQTKDGIYRSHEQDDKHSELSLRKQLLKNKQILLQSKNSCIKFKEERIQQSQQYTQKYIQALKQSVSAYEQMFTKNMQQQKDQQKNNQVMQSIKQTKDKQEEYNKLCRARLSQCEELIIKLKQESNGMRNQINKIKAENIKYLNQKQQKDVMIQQYRQMIGKQDKQRRTQIDMFREKTIQLNKNNAHLTAQNTKKDKIIEEINSKCSNLQKQVQNLSKSDKKNVSFIQDMKKQLKNLQNSKNQIEQKLNEAIDENKSLKLMNIQFKQELQYVKKQVNQRKQDLRKEHSKEQELKHSIDLKYQKYEQKQKENKQIISSLQRKVTAHQAKIKQLKKQLKQTKNIHEQETKNLNNKQRDLSKLVKQLTQQGAELRQENQKLVLKLNNKYIEIENLHKTIKKLESIIQQQIQERNREHGQKFKQIQNLTQKKPNRIFADHIQFNEENLQQLKQKIQQQIQNQWMKNNKQIEQIILQISEMTKENKIKKQLTNAVNVSDICQ